MICKSVGKDSYKRRVTALRIVVTVKISEAVLGSLSRFTANIVHIVAAGQAGGYGNCHKNYRRRIKYPHCKEACHREYYELAQ